MLRSFATKVTLAGAIAALPFAASAQNFTKIYDFSSTATGGNPAVVSQPVGTPIMTGSATMYGVSYYGGSPTCVSNDSACGAFFKLIPPAGAGDPWTETTLYEFGGVSDGGAPNANPIYVGGTFYGTTYGGGAMVPDTGNGTVYSMTPSGVHTVLYAFAGGSDGSRPTFMTTLGGSMYGITNFGGSTNAGVVFQVTPSGAETIIHTFNGTTEGSVPQYIIAYEGALYVSLSNGGANDGGTVVKLTPPAHGTTWTASVIFSFGGSASTAFNPEGIGFGSNGYLYGVTTEGGGSPSCSFITTPGCGAVFQLKPPTTGTAWTITQIYAFTGGTDSGAPYAPPAFDSLGNIYVTSTGTLVTPSSFGAILEFSPGNDNTFTAAVQHTFIGSDGADPAGLLSFGSTGGVYGLATYGGTGTGTGNGTAYSVTPLP